MALILKKKTLNRNIFESTKIPIPQIVLTWLSNLIFKEKKNKLIIEISLSQIVFPYLFWSSKRKQKCLILQKFQYLKLSLYNFTCSVIENINTLNCLKDSSIPIFKEDTKICLTITISIRQIIFKNLISSYIQREKI